MKQGGVPVRRGDYTVLFHFFTPLRRQADTSPRNASGGVLVHLCAKKT